MPVLFRYAEMPEVPWANGKGTTTELVSFDRSRTLSPESLPDWRLSIARLSGPAAFSPFPGVCRVFLPVGTGVTLTVNGTERRVPDRVATAFGGDDVVELRGLDCRPAHAVNLMYRTGAHRAVPGLAVVRGDDAALRTCLLAVSLENSLRAGMFDAFTVDPHTAPPESTRWVALVGVHHC